VEQELKQHFQPEFLNRVDDVIIFNPLSRENIAEIVKLQIAALAVRLRDRGITIELTKRALEYLVQEGFDPQFGARPLKRAIQNHLLNPLSVRLLSGEKLSDQKIKVDSDGKKIVFGK
jgi:ATP-dependent Clp protease ATP-binding subunit ClpB